MSVPLTFFSCFIHSGICDNGKIKTSDYKIKIQLIAQTAITRRPLLMLDETDWKESEVDIDGRT